MNCPSARADDAKKQLAGIPKEPANDF